MSQEKNKSLWYCIFLLDGKPSGYKVKIWMETTDIGLQDHKLIYGQIKVKYG